MDSSQRTGVDTALLAWRIQEGDTQAEEEFVRFFAPSIETLAKRRLRDPEDARELADDVLVAAIVALRRGVVREPDRLPAFVHGIAKKLIKNYYRRQARRPPIEQIAAELFSPDVIPGYENRDRVRVCRRVLAELESADRQILHLALVEGLRSSEIAKIVEMTPVAVRQRKSRSIKKIVNAVCHPPPRAQAILETRQG